MNLSVILMVVLEIVFFIFTDSFMAVFASGYKEGISGDKDLLIKLTGYYCSTLLYDDGRADERHTQLI